MFQLNILESIAGELFCCSYLEHVHGEALLPELVAQHVALGAVGGRDGGCHLHTDRQESAEMKMTDH